MANLQCIFAAHCTRGNCDSSCPDLAQTSYLLDMNEIKFGCKHVFMAGQEAINKALRVIDKAENDHIVVVNKANTREAADLYTYIGICKHWKGSRLKMVVYNLKLSKFFDAEKNSWDNKKSISDNPTEDPDYMKIWADKAKLLVISNFDYVNFKDYNVQFLLNLLQKRDIEGLATIIVSPTTSLIGNGDLFDKLPGILTKYKVDESTLNKPILPYPTVHS